MEQENQESRRGPLTGKAATRRTAGELGSTAGVVSPRKECSKSDNCCDYGGQNHWGQTKIQKTQHNGHDLHGKEGPAEDANCGGSGAGQVSEMPAKKCR